MYDNPDAAVRQKWKEWSLLACDVYRQSICHTKWQAECAQSMASLTVWRPTANQQLQARRIGATFTPIMGCMQLLRDPCAQTMIMEVRPMDVPVHPSPLNLFLGTILLYRHVLLAA